MLRFAKGLHEVTFRFDKRSSFDNVALGVVPVTSTASSVYSNTSVEVMGLRRSAGAWYAANGSLVCAPAQAPRRLLGVDDQWSAGDLVTVRLDLDAWKASFFKNGESGRQR